MDETSVQRGFRPALRRREAVLCYRVINGPRGMKDVWRDSNGLQMRSQNGVEVVDDWSDGQIALLPPYQRSIVRDDQRLIERALNSDGGGRPVKPSQQPTRISPEKQRLIDDVRRRESTADSVIIGGRHYYGCRVPD